MSKLGMCLITKQYREKTVMGFILCARARVCMLWCDLAERERESNNYYFDFAFDKTNKQTNTCVFALFFFPRLTVDVLTFCCCCCWPSLCLPIHIGCVEREGASERIIKLSFVVGRGSTVVVRWWWQWQERWARLARLEFAFFLFWMFRWLWRVARTTTS